MLAPAPPVSSSMLPLHHFLHSFLLPSPPSSMPPRLQIRHHSSTLHPHHLLYRHLPPSLPYPTLPRLHIRRQAPSLGDLPKSPFGMSPPYLPRRLECRCRTHRPPPCTSLAAPMPPFHPSIGNLGEPGAVNRNLTSRPNVGLQSYDKQSKYVKTLGTFLARAILPETNSRTHIEADLRPFRDFLLGLFFVTTGTSIDMQLNEDSGPLQRIFVKQECSVSLRHNDRRNNSTDTSKTDRKLFEDDDGRPISKP